jgi:vacuolar-type H+-ATPase subunit D/Vma8
MIHHIFKQNRMPSINFMAEINQYMMSQMEERNQLNHTLNELVTKKSTIDEEIRQMGKSVKEMKQLCDLKEKKDDLNRDIGEQEVRINAIRKTLSQQKG